MSREKREAGFHCDSGDWPVGPKHPYTPDEVIQALAGSHGNVLADPVSADEEVS